MPQDFCDTSLDWAKAAEGTFSFWESSLNAEYDKL
jgi:hypothetical protein